MTRDLLVDGVRISDDTDCYVIAEIGHNHQGQLEQCKELFRAAKECGADAVKLQKRDNRTLFTKNMYDSPYNSENAYAETYGAHREVLEFGEDEYTELKFVAKELGITFFSTAFDHNSADFIAKMDLPAIKIASGDITNIPLIKYLAEIGKPMFISTGGATMADVQRAHDAVMPINSDICIMQCTSGYPPDYAELNLQVISTYREAFRDIAVGFSAHDSGIAMAVGAYVLGARAIEKHFTLNRAAKGTDHAFSLERPGMRRMVRDLKRIRISLGSGVKEQYPSEKAPLFKMAKKLVAARALPEGHVLTAEDIGIRSPNDGVPPYEFDNFVGRRLAEPLGEDDNLSFENTESP